MTNAARQPHLLLAALILKWFFVTKYLSYKMVKYELWPVNMAQHGKTTKIEAAHDVGIQSLSDCRFKDNAVWGKS